jgi:urea ABC transporter ATP-binding protein UrtD
MLLEIRNLTKAFGGLIAVDHLNLKLKNGGIHAIIGPNGAGKTTLFNLITGRVKPTSGLIFFKNEDITNLSIHEISQRGIAIKFQRPSLFESLSVLENIAISVKANRKIWKNFYGSFEDNEQVKSILKNVRLMDKKEVRVSRLSYGEKQWLEIGMVLANDPELILLDEPTSGMSVKEKEETAKLIKNIAVKKTILITEHDFHFIKKIADDVTVLHRGKILAQGTIQDIEKNHEVKEVYLGER